MFSVRSLGIGWPSFLSSGATTGPKIDLQSVAIHDIEENTDKRARTLKHLIKANHINHSIIYHDLRYHNHVPHVLGSAYILGANADQLNTIYDVESEGLEPWSDSPGEIALHDWRDFLGKRNYQRAFVDFFEDQLVQHGYDWRDLVSDFLYEGEAPLINNLVSGLAHPLIHLGYAFELSSRTVAIEALALAACFYDYQHKYLDDPSYSKPSSWVSTKPLEILERLARDSRFDGMVSASGEEAYEAMIDNEDSEREALVLEYWNAWKLEDLAAQFVDSQKAAAALLVASKAKGHQYDFFLVHLLTSSHAVRKLIPLVPAKWQLNLVRQWWLFVVRAYISQRRPSFDLSRVEDFDIKGRDWKYVEDRALNSQYATDAHFVKGCRSMQVAAQTWGDKDGFYQKAAVKFAEEFDGWGG